MRKRFNAVAQEPAVGSEKRTVPCYDPATKEYLGSVPALCREDVQKRISAAEKAAAVRATCSIRGFSKLQTTDFACLQVWKDSSFQQRRFLLKILLKFIAENQDEICR